MLRRLVSCHIVLGPTFLQEEVHQDQEQAPQSSAIIGEAVCDEGKEHADKDADHDHDRNNHPHNDHEDDDEDDNTRTMSSFLFVNCNTPRKRLFAFG